MRICGECCLIGVEMTQKGKPFGATLKHQFRIRCAAPYKLAQIVPIPFDGLRQFRKPFVGLEGIAHLPQLGHDEFSDQCVGHGPICELIEVPNIAWLLALIGCAYFFGEDFLDAKTRYHARLEG